MAERIGYWAGLPSAQELRQLDEIAPGLGMRAFAIVEREQRQTHRAQWAGIIVSSLVAFGSLGGSLYFLSQGDTTGGGSLAISSAAGIVTTYLSRLIPSRMEQLTSVPAATASGTADGAVSRSAT
jgi:hypothetical protein